MLAYWNGKGTESSEGRLLLSYLQTIAAAFQPFLGSQATQVKLQSWWQALYQPVRLCCVHSFPRCRSLTCTSAQKKPPGNHPCRVSCPQKRGPRAASQCSDSHINQCKTTPETGWGEKWLLSEQSLVLVGLHCISVRGRVGSYFTQCYL